MTTIMHYYIQLLGSFYPSLLTIAYASINKDYQFNNRNLHVYEHAFNYLCKYY